MKLRRWLRVALMSAGLSWAACGGHVEHGGESGGAGAAGVGGSEPTGGRSGAAGAGAAEHGDAGSGGDQAGAGGDPQSSAGAGGTSAEAGESGASGGLQCDYSDGHITSDASHGLGCWAMCGDTSVNFWDWMNCGGCDQRCNVGSETCDLGKCVTETCFPGTASCTEPGCNDHVDTPDNCGACGVVAHPLAHAVALCSCAGECEDGVCAPGYANCDRASNDCETPLTTSGTCAPTPGAAWCVPSPYLDATIALASDGTLFIGGGFSTDFDFDPSPAVDVHPHLGGGTQDTFLTKFNADGSYAWTTTWSAFLLSGVRAGSDGSVVAFGSAAPMFGSTNIQTDLDPGPAVDLHTQSTALVKLDANGSYAWGKTWGGSNTIRDVAVDSSGRVYVAGDFLGKLDADPGAASHLIGVGGTNNGDFLLSLDAAGQYRWARSTTSARCGSGLGAIALSGEQLWASGALGQCVGKTDPVIQNLTDSVPSTPPDSTTLFLVNVDLNGVVERALSVSSGGYASSGSLVIGSGGNLYVGVDMFGTVDFEPGPGSVLRTGSSNGVLSLTPDGAYRWVRSGSSTVPGNLSPAPNDGVLAAFQQQVVKLDSDGSPGFTLDPTGRSQVVLAASDAVGFVILRENHAHCLFGLEVQRYTW